MAGINDLPCAECAHPFRDHERSVNIRERRRCSVTTLIASADKDDSTGWALSCGCKQFAWQSYEEDTDALWDEYKAGYVDIDGNAVEPAMDEP